MNFANDLLGSNIVYAFGWSMIHSVWQSGIVALILLFVLQLLRPYSAQARYLASLIAMLTVAIIFTATFLRAYAATLNPISTVALADTAASIEPLATFNDRFSFSIGSFIDAYLPHIVSIWAIGFSLLIMKYVAEFLYCRHLLNTATTAMPSHWQFTSERLHEQLHISKRAVIRLTNQIDVPCVIGHIKPVILVPLGLMTSLQQQQLEAILLHELAHIKRKDYLVGLFQCFTTALLFFNPILHWISSRIDIERENACDDIAVEACGDRLLFASALKDVAKFNLQNSLAMASNRSKKTTLLRIDRLLEPTAFHHRYFYHLVAGIAITLCCASLSVYANLWDTTPTSDLLPDESAAQELAELNTGNEKLRKILRNRKRITYPEDALENDIGGKVKAKIWVSAQGEVEDVRIVEATPPGYFEQAVIDAVKHWHFIPKKTGGKPVAFQIVKAVTFTSTGHIPKDDGTKQKRRYSIRGTTDKVYLPQAEVNHKRNRLKQIVRIPIHFPREISSDGVNASDLDIEVKVQYSVNKEGSTEDIKIIQATPSGFGIEEAVIEAIKQWKYSPKLVDGKPTETKNVTATISRSGTRTVVQTINEKPRISENATIQRNQRLHQTVSIPAQYPVAALQNNIGGEVKVQFTVNAEGNTEGIEIIAAAPPGYGFAESVHKAVAQWQFASQVIDGKPQAVKGLVKTIRFKTR